MQSKVDKAFGSPLYAVNPLELTCPLSTCGIDVGRELLHDGDVSDNGLARRGRVVLNMPGGMASYRYATLALMNLRG
eukprot:1632768-Pyramimonas_sp.AAC.1